LRGCPFEPLWTGPLTGPRWGRSWSSLECPSMVSRNIASSWEKVRSGDVILTGTCTGITKVSPGHTVEGWFGLFRFASTPKRCRNVVAMVYTLPRVCAAGTIRQLSELYQVYDDAPSLVRQCKGSSSSTNVPIVGRTMKSGSFAQVTRLTTTRSAHIAETSWPSGTGALGTTAE
jgi:hypothetical protein